MTGQVTFIIHLKGYGFIKDENGDDRFLHAKDLRDPSLFPKIREGDYVEFEPTQRNAPGRNNGLGVTKVSLCD